MAVPQGKPGFSWIGLLLLTGLSILSWASSYSGMMELIAASSGEEIAIGTRVAAAFAVLMLQLMILYVLDALFSRSLRWWLRPFYLVGYAMLVLVAAGFAFGFYWKHLEAGRAATEAAEEHLHTAQAAMQLGASRLEQLQATFATLETIAMAKAEKESATGGTCSGGGAGDGPRRRMRNADAQRFQFANAFLARRVGDVKTDMAGLDGALQKVLGGASTTAAMGTRGSLMAGINSQLRTITVRFNALASEPQLLQLRDEFRLRAVQTVFPGDNGATFSCPDPQLQTALSGAVRAIGELPQLRQVQLSAYEGSEAVVEAFRRLTVSGIVAWRLMAAGAQNMLAQTGAVDEADPAASLAGGLTERDYVPLLIAIFVDFSILLISINRPIGRAVHVLASMDRARGSRMIEFLLPIYRVFTDNFDPAFNPAPGEVISPLVDVVFDHRGKYYAAAPLDYGARRDPTWIQAAANRARQRGETFVYAPTAGRTVERSRYISSALVVLQGQGLVTLLNKRRVLTDEVVRRKLERQGSLYAQADSFRIYAFAPGAWPEFLQATVGSGAEAEGHNAADTRGRAKSRGRVHCREIDAELMEPVRRTDRRDFPAPQTLTLKGEHVFYPRPAIATPPAGKLALTAPAHPFPASDDGVDFDPSEETCGGLKFNTSRGNPA